MCKDVCRIVRFGVWQQGLHGLSARRVSLACCDGRATRCCFISIMRDNEMPIFGKAAPCCCMRPLNGWCAGQGYTALLHAAVKCGEMDLAIDLYKQMGAQGLPRDRQSFQLLVDVYVKARSLTPAAWPQNPVKCTAFRRGC